MSHADQLLDRLTGAVRPVELAVALSLCRPSGLYIAAASSGLEVAWLRWGQQSVMAEASGQVARESAAQNLARGMATDAVRPLQAPRPPVRCDTCHRRLTTPRREAAA